MECDIFVSLWVRTLYSFSFPFFFLFFLFFAFFFFFFIFLSFFNLGGNSEQKPDDLLLSITRITKMESGRTIQPRMDKLVKQRLFCWWNDLSQNTSWTKTGLRLNSFTLNLAQNNNKINIDYRISIFQLLSHVTS